MTMVPLPPFSSPDGTALVNGGIHGIEISIKGQVARFRNVSGATMPRGTAARLSTTVNFGAILSQGSFDERIIGVTLADLPDGEEGDFVIAGRAFARLSNTVRPGRAIVSSSTPGVLQASSSFGRYAQVGWGITNAPAGLVEILIAPPSEVY